QIAFLVDAHRGLAREYNILHYALFVTWFPHLIAGPILHHREMMPQFQLRATYRLDWENIAVGLTMFVIGLFKKTVIADDLAGFVTPAFNAAATGTSLTLLEAWGAALAYTFQIYFDFSGYTDMALGASRMFGIVLPLNFRSPYKATSVIDFWRRWHITLSRFLRDYVYIPLGGNRRSSVRRYVNLLATMLIGGLWHGAAWTFVIWGALHGAYLMVNHGWRWLHHRFAVAALPGGGVLATLVTFLAVVVAWVFFRAPDAGTAFGIIAGMAGQHGVVLPLQWQPAAGATVAWFVDHGVAFGQLAYFNRITQLNWLCFLLVFCQVAPNTQQLLAAYRPALLTPGYGELADAGALAWRPNLAWLLALTAMGVLGILSIHRYSEFIYFRF
ncbi:MAG TPA: MBOAT family O-acyltransferase, partial [Casimicrobiaceae bacterium]